MVKKNNPKTFCDFLMNYPSIKVRLQLAQTTGSLLLCRDMLMFLFSVWAISNRKYSFHDMEFPL